jgi:hypothetical protein
MAFTARPKIQSQSQIFRYSGSIFCLPYRPNFSDIFDLCLHWVSVVRGDTYENIKKLVFVPGQGKLLGDMSFTKKKLLRINLVLWGGGARLGAIYS